MKSSKKKVPRGGETIEKGERWREEKKGLKGYVYWLVRTSEGNIG